MATSSSKAQKLPRPGEKRRWVRWLVLLALAGIVLAGAGGLALFLILGSDPDLPRIDHVADYHPKVVTKIVSADGELIGEIYEERRTVVAKDKIPEVMKHAIVDAEDAGFYEHGGLSYWGMLRALVNDLKPGAHVQGASTLTQQLVRNLILKSNARGGWAGVKRKVQEMILAKRLDGALSKDEILYLYLNQIEFPYNRYGIEEASRFYFGKSVTEIDAGEAALLASLPKGPSEIDPWKHPERAKDRQRYVLSQMARYKHLTPQEAEKFARTPIALVRSPAPFNGIAPEFVDEVKKVLTERFGAKKLATLGVTVETTCDARIQKLTREAVEKGLVALDERHGYRKPLAHLTGKALDAHVRKLAKEFPGVPSPGKVVEGVVDSIGDNTIKINLGSKMGILPAPATADRYNPKALLPSARFKVGDVLRVRVIDTQPELPVLALELGPQAAAVVLDPNTHEVKALVGGYGYRPGALDRAVSAGPCRSDKPMAGCRQPGSAFKPFVYAAAFNTQKWTPASVLIDGPQVYASPGLQPWMPKNAEKEEYLGPVRLRVALARSLNTVASQLVDVQRGGVDPTEVVKLAHDAGIDSQLDPNPSLALGTGVVSPLELTNAYATFASGGRRGQPIFLRKIGDQPEPEAMRATSQVMAPPLAYLVTSMLTSVIDEGTAASAKGKLMRPAAGKTGTTNAHKDAWFVGFTPDLVTGVWVGFDDMRELGRGEQGARAALPMWVDIMTGALKGVPPKPFSQPPGLVVQKIDPASGLLASPGAANAIDEVFLDGTAPTQTARTQGEANPDTYIIDQQ